MPGLRRGLLPSALTRRLSSPPGGESSRSSLVDIVFRSRSSPPKETKPTTPRPKEVTNDIQARLRARKASEGGGRPRAWSEGNPLPYRVWRVWGRGQEVNQGRSHPSKVLRDFKHQVFRNIDTTSVRLSVPLHRHLPGVAHLSQSLG